MGEMRKIRNRKGRKASFAALQMRGTQNAQDK
jgi:hypothetical protein